MISRVEAIKRLHLILTTTSTSGADLEEVVFEAFGTSLDHITQPAPIKDMARRVILWSENQGQVLPLARAAVERAPSHPLVIAYREELLAALDCTTTTNLGGYPPYETCFVAGQQAFIGRLTLRQFIRDLAEPYGVHVLVVNGLSRTGKTYSLQLLSYVSNHQEPPYQLAWATLENEVASTYAPETLARRYAAQLGWNEGTIPQRPSTRYAKEIAWWIIGEAKRARVPQVLVFDSFNKVDLHAETRELVQELLTAVSATTSRVRLVMLNYEQDLFPPVLPGPVRGELVAVLTRHELVEYFKTVAQHRGVTAESAVVQRIVDSVVSAVPVGASHPNEKLNELVTAAAMRL
ncbi:MAG TPA: effector-associated domain EAD1-containing protein [Gemmatirosa sp.]